MLSVQELAALLLLIKLSFLLRPKIMTIAENLTTQPRGDVPKKAKSNLVV